MTWRRGDDCGSSELPVGGHEAYGLHADYDFEDGYHRRGDRASYLPDIPFLAGV